MINLKMIKKALIITVCSLAALSPAYSRKSVNMARNSENTTDFFLEKQKHDAALSEHIPFYSLDSWYFESFIHNNPDLILQNTFAPGTRDLYGTAESSFYWYLDIANGDYPEYREFLPYAQYVISLCYSRQCGTMKDYSASRTFAAKCYDSGFAGASVLLAQQIEESWADANVAKIKPQTLYESAAAEDFPEALLELSRRTSGKQAQDLLIRAMVYNDKEAYWMAATDFLSTKGKELTGNIAKRISEAEQLLLQAEALYDAKSAMLLGDLYAGRICAPTEYSMKLCTDKENPLVDSEKAVTHYTNAAMYGEPAGFAALAAIYREGYFGATDKDMASFYYYKYRDALYEKRIATESAYEALRTFYEDEGNDADETICLDIATYFKDKPLADGKLSPQGWLTNGAQKGSAACKLELAHYYEGERESLKWYIEAMNSSNFYPLSNEKRNEAEAAVTDIYAQILQAQRFKNNVDYWLATKDGETDVSKKASDMNPLILPAATKRQALKWFKNKAETGGIFEKTWYAWLLVEDNEASTYKIPSVAKRPDRDVKDAWDLVEAVLSADPSYAPAIVLEARCMEKGYGSRKKPREARKRLEAAAELGYGEAFGLLAQHASDKTELIDYVTKGCNAKDEFSFYQSYSKVIWLEDEEDLTESLAASVKYGYLPAYLVLADKYTADAAITFDDNFENLDYAYKIDTYCEKLAMQNASAKRNYIEQTFYDKMEKTDFAYRMKIDGAKKTVAAEANSKNILALAQIYEAADGYLDDARSEAAKYYLLAAKQGNAEAMEHIAKCYETGFGVNKNNENAYNWFAEAESYGSVNVYTKLGHMLIEGYGTERDVEKGLDYYRKELEQTPDSPVAAELHCFEGLPEQTTGEM